MKKKILAGVLATCAVTGLTACNQEVSVSKIEIAGQDVEFNVGEAFDDGELVVTATLSDGTVKTVVEGVTVDSSNVDTTKPGVYSVVVSYEGQNVVYNVTVSAPVVATVTKIEVSGQNANFTVGDTFATGSLSVVATYSDSTTKDVTANASVDTSAVDTTKAGVYAVIVSYEGAITTYYVNVVNPEAPENVATLKDVTVNATDVKTQYVIGEEVSLENLVVYETYSNTIGDDTLAQFTDLSGYTVTVTNEDNEVVTGAFTAWGTYTVNVTKGELSDGYTVKVGSVVYESAKEALEAALENSDKVNGGNIAIEYYGMLTEYSYAYGENYTTYDTGDSVYHLTLKEDGSVFGVYTYEDWDGNAQISSVYEPTEDYMAGPDLSSVVQYQADVYGIENLVSFLYEAGSDVEAENVWNFKEGFANYCSVCGVYKSYTFSYESYVNDYYYNFIDVEFTVDPETNALSNVVVKMDVYYSDSMNYDETNNKYTVKEEITEPDFQRVVESTQNMGDRDLENEYTPEVYQFASFDLVSEETTLTSESTVESVVRESVYIQLDNVTPATANISVDDFNVTAYDADGFESYSVFGGYNEDYECIVVTAYKVGDYTIEVKTANVTKTFTLKVNYADLTSIEAAVYNTNEYDYVATSSVEVYANVEVDIKALANENANGAYTAALASTYENATLEEGYDDNYLFTATAEGTYEVVLTSTVNSELTATLTITVLPAPSAADILVGTYQFFSPMWGTVTYVFTPESEGAENGTVSIEAVGGYADASGLFNYEYADGYLSCVPANAGSAMCYFSCSLSSNFEVICVYNGWEQGVCSKVEETTENSCPVVGVHSAVVTNLAGMSIPYSIEFKADGTGVYNFANAWYYGSFSYEYTDGVVSFYDVTPLLGTNEISLTAYLIDTTLSVTYENEISEDEIETLTISFEVAASEDVEDEEAVVGEIEVEASWFGEEYTYTATEAGTYTFSVDSAEGYIGYDYELVSSVEVYLSAGDSIVLTMVTASNTGSTQTVTLLVSKEVIESTSDFETAITCTWFAELGMNDYYYLTFTPGDTNEAGTVSVVNEFEGSVWGTSTYTYTYDETNGLTLTPTDDESDLLSWYFGGCNASFDSTFNYITVGYYSFEVQE